MALGMTSVMLSPRRFLSARAAFARCAAGIPVERHEPYRSDNSRKRHGERQDVWIPVVQERFRRKSEKRDGRDMRREYGERDRPRRQHASAGGEPVRVAATAAPEHEAAPEQRRADNVRDYDCLVDCTHFLERGLRRW